MKTDWKKRFDKKFNCGENKPNFVCAWGAKQFLSKEIDKAREEGWQSGYRQGSEKDLK